MAQARSIPWMRPLSAAGGPLYMQIAQLVEDATVAGGLKPGDRLPPQRQLAQALGVDLTTVSRAYAQVRQRGLLDAVTGRGSFIAARSEYAGPPIDLGMNIPPSPKGVRLGELIRRGVGEIVARSNVDLLMSYHIGPGSLADRAAAASWLAPVLGPVEPQRIVVAAGAQPSLVALLANLAAPGGAVLVDPLVYPGMLAAARHLGLRLVPVAGDRDGMRPDALVAAAQRHGAALLYLVPTMHNPTGLTIPEARRRDLASVAARCGLKILEDDPYARLAGDAPPAFATLAPALTYHVATLSKGLTPGLRTAFIVLPPAASADAVAAALRMTTLMTAPLMTALATHWIRIGAAEEILLGVRAEAGLRQALAAAILPQALPAHLHALHVWLPLPPHWGGNRLVEAARRQGLGVTHAEAFTADGAAPDAVRLSLGGVPDRAKLAAALKTLARIIGGKAGAEAPVV